MAASTSRLAFSPIRVGNVTLKHRIVMCPLTRYRANIEHVHEGVAVEYYGQRASTPGTLLITEATAVAPEASGQDNSPGIWSEAQIAAWKKVTDEVHSRGSFIFLQLWALGRAAFEKEMKRDGFDIVSASDIAFEGGAKPRPLTTDEIATYVSKFATGAKNAIAAGFDGVEIHGANGYLIDQFLQDVSNKRTDEYGGGIENRMRFGLEVVKAVVEAVGQEKTGIRLSPYSAYQGMGMADPIPTFSAFISEISKLYPSFAYIHVIEDTPYDGSPKKSTDFAQKLWLESGVKDRVYISAGGWSTETDAALKLVEDKPGIIAALGRAFLANPDLPVRLRDGIQQNAYDRATFYMNGPDKTQGYIDYPFANEVKS